MHLREYFWLSYRFSGCLTVVPGFSAPHGAAQAEGRSVCGAKRVNHQSGMQREGEPHANHHLDQDGTFIYLSVNPEPVFLNVYGAQESIPRNEFRQPM